MAGIPALAQEQPEQGAVADLDAVVVTGSALQGKAEIETRREATAIVDTLSNDEIGALPDITIAESLRRITGVTTIYNDDIGQFASIRGTHPDFVPITLNGLSIATTGDLGEGTRKVNLQVIPAGAVRQLQAYKTLSPELDAGALGGLVNIVPASAFDLEQPLFGITVGTSYSTYMDVPDDNSGGDSKDSPFGKSARFSWAPRFGAGQSVGLLVTGIYEQRPRTQSNDAITNRLYYNDAGTATTPESADWNGYGAPNSFVSHNYTNLFTKYGGTARLEFHPGGAFRTSLFGYAYFSDEQETRNTNRVYSLDQFRDQTATTGTARVRAADTQWRYNTFERDQMGLQWRMELETGGKGRLSADLGWSRAWFRSDRPFVAFVYRPNTRLRYDLDGGDRLFELDDGDAYLDPANYQTGDHYDDRREATSHARQGRIDYGFNNGTGDRGLGFGAGADFRIMDMQRDNSGTWYRPGTASLEGLAFVPGFATPGYTHPALWLDQEAFWNRVAPNLAVDEAATATQNRINDYDYREKVLAGYLDTVYTTDAMRLDAGLRLDRIDYRADMAQVADGELQPAPVRYRGRDTNVLPYFNGIFSLAPSLRIKAAASRTLGRPNPETIATVEDTDHDDRNIVRGNPEIQPRKSTNLDLGLEYYFNDNLGMATLTGFHKRIEDDILNLSYVQVIDGETWTVSQPVNGETTRYKGLELGFINTSFGILHPRLQPLGASLNMMWVEGESSFLYDGERRKRDRLQFQSDFAANAAVFWSFASGSELRLAVNRQGLYVEEYAANPWQDIYIAPFTTVDLTARWAITPSLQLRLEGRNILGANRERRTGPRHEYYRAGLEVGSTWFLQLSYRY